LAVATAEAVAAPAIALGTIATVGRWGSSSLAAVAGGQAVVGAAGWTGDAALVVSSWCAAIAIALGGCGRRRWSITVAGVSAGLIVAGPSAATGRGALLRLAGAVGGVAVAAVASRLLRPRPRAVVATVAGGAACLALARASGPITWSGALDGSRAVDALVLAGAAVLLAVAGTRVASRLLR
jgi:hypothetical protein